MTGSRLSWIRRGRTSRPRVLPVRYHGKKFLHAVEGVIERFRNFLERIRERSIQIENNEFDIGHQR